MVTCDRCRRGVMAAVREDYPYDECGVSGVVLVSLELRRCILRSCREVEVVIPEIEKLHKQLAPGRSFFHCREGWVCLPQAPYRAVDVASEILWQYGVMPAHKLHKVCYYAQCAHLAVVGRPLFSGLFRAAPNGPVHPDLDATWGSDESYAQARPRPDNVVWVPEVNDVVRHYASMAAARLLTFINFESYWMRMRGRDPGQAEIPEWMLRNRGKYLLDVRQEREADRAALLARIRTQHGRDEDEFEACRQSSTPHDESHPSVDPYQMHQDRAALLDLVQQLLGSRPLLKAGPAETCWFDASSDEGLAAGYAKKMTAGGGCVATVWRDPEIFGDDRYHWACYPSQGSEPVSEGASDSLEDGKKAVDMELLRLGSAR